MKEFTLNAKLVRAAMLFQAKFDVRWYLNGFRVTSQRIAATNGHVAWWHDFAEFEIDSEVDYIIRITKAVPAKCDHVTFKFDSEKAGVAYCKTFEGLVLCVIYFEVIEGKYPDFAKIIPTDDPVPTAVIGVRAEYMHLIEKAANIFNSRFGQLRMELRGQDRSIIFEMPSMEFNSTALVMPTRL